jgi:ABC-type Fe3+ transport system permease subunit
VVLPLLRPAFTVVIGTSLMLSIAVFDEISVMTQGGPGRASEVLSLYLYSKTFRDQMAGVASAIGVVMFILSALGGTMYVKQMIKQEAHLGARVSKPICHLHHCGTHPHQRATPCLVCTPGCPDWPLVIPAADRGLDFSEDPGRDVHHTSLAATGRATI